MLTKIFLKTAILGNKTSKIFFNSLELQTIKSMTQILSKIRILILDQELTITIRALLPEPERGELIRLVLLAIGEIYCLVEIKIQVLKTIPFNHKVKDFKPRIGKLILVPSVQLRESLQQPIRLFH